jgi:hypothetical protein
LKPHPRESGPSGPREANREAMGKQQRLVDRVSNEVLAHGSNRNRTSCTRCRLPHKSMTDILLGQCKLHHERALPSRKRPFSFSRRCRSFILGARRTGGRRADEHADAARFARLPRRC